MEKPETEPDNSSITSSLVREFTYKVYLEWQKEDMDILPATWQVLRGYIEQGMMDRDAGA